MSNQNIVFEIGGLRFRSGLVDENGQITSRVAFESPARPEEVVEHIQRIVESYSVSAPKASVGIAIGGIVDKNGNVTSGSMNMADFPLEAQLGLKRRVVVINDAKAAALAEATYNQRLCCKNSFILMTISGGIGGGVVLNGELYEGHNGTAGEVGHLIIDQRHDYYCRLGHRGCLDALASGRALDNRLRKLWREGHWTQYEGGVNIKHLTELLTSNDGMAHQVIHEIGQWIGQGVMQIIRVIDPCEVIFKGFLAMELWPYLEPHVYTVIASYDRKINMSLSALGDNVGLVGAGLAINRQRESLAVK